MQLDTFKDLQQRHGTDVVYEDDGKYVFVISEKVADMDVYRYIVIEEYLEDLHGITLHYNGDDVQMNSIEAACLEDIDETMEEFLVEYTGHNYFTEFV